MINHTDCDSILSSGIMSGRLQPLDAYRAAALAADHTGEENPIADMLQGMGDVSDDEALAFCHPERSEGSPSSPRLTPSPPDPERSEGEGPAWSPRLTLAFQALAALEAGSPLPPLAQ